MSYNNNNMSINGNHSNYYIRRNNQQGYTHSGTKYSTGNSNQFYNKNVNNNNNGNGNGNQLYMGDLDPAWDERTIKLIWSSLGETNIIVKMMWSNNVDSNMQVGPMSDVVNNQGYCFIEFPSNMHASNALMKNGIPIPNFPQRRLKLNWASSSSNHSTFVSNNHSMNANNPNNNCSIFVGDLAPNVAEAQLFELFIGRYSSTEHAKIVYDQQTGVSKGYGFVRFGNPIDQKRAMVEMQGVFLNGRAIKIGNTGVNKYHDKMNSSNSNNSNIKSNLVVGSGSSRASNPINNSQFMYPVQQQPILNHFTDPNNTTVFIGGLSSLVTEDELREYFKPFGTIVYVKIPIGKGCGFVQYIDRVSAETAISRMQGFPIANSRIRLSWGRSAKQTAMIQQSLQAQAQTHVLQQQQQQQHSGIMQTHQPSVQQPDYGFVPSISTTPMNFISSQETNSFSSNNLLPGFQTYPNGNTLLEGHDMASASNHLMNNIFNSTTDSLFDRLEKGSNGFMYA